MSTLKAIRDFFNKDLSYNKETACFLVGGGTILSLSTLNQPAAVAFDWEKIWEKVKGLDHYPDVFYMIHTHPPGMEDMSPIDRNMVHGWVQALGKTIRFAILCEGKYHLYRCQKIDKRVRIEDYGFREIGNEIPCGEIIGMIMTGISQGNDNYDLDGIVEEMNFLIESMENRKEIVSYHA